MLIPILSEGQQTELIRLSQLIGMAVSLGGWMWKCVDLINKAVDKLIEGKVNNMRDELMEFINGKFEQHEEHERTGIVNAVIELRRLDDLRTGTHTEFPTNKSS